MTRWCFLQDWHFVAGLTAIRPWFPLEGHQDKRNIWEKYVNILSVISFARSSRQSPRKHGLCSIPITVTKHLIVTNFVLGPCLAVSWFVWLSKSIRNNKLLTLSSWRSMRKNASFMSIENIMGVPWILLMTLLIVCSRLGALANVWFNAPEGSNTSLALVVPWVLRAKLAGNQWPVFSSGPAGLLSCSASFSGTICQ